MSEIREKGRGTKDIIVRPWRRAWTLAALGAILCAGAWLRMAELDSVPPGLWFDEALNLQDAWAAAQPGGHFKLVYPDEFPREPMFETLLILGTRIFGPNPTALRFIPAAIGTLTILLLFGLLRGSWGTGPALAAAAALATMRWHVIFSHILLRTIILPAWMIGLVWAALAWRRRPTWGRALIFGIMVGGGFYTYLAWYFLLPLVGGICLWLVWSECGTAAPGCDSDSGMTAEGGCPTPKTVLWLIAIGAAVLVFLPLGIHYLHYPQHLLARPGAVSPFADPLPQALRAIAKNAWDAVRMFNWRGDHVPKQNIPWAPALNLTQGIVFWIGVVFCVLRARRRDPLAWIILGWIICGLLATILTKTDSPNFLRTLAITPAVAAAIGLGVTSLKLPGARKPYLGIAAAVVLVFGWAEQSDREVRYVWAQRDDVWRSFNGDIVQFARTAAAQPADVAVFVPQFLSEHRSFRYLTMGKNNVFPYSDWSVLGAWPPAGVPAGTPTPRARLILFTGHHDLLSILRQIAPDGQMVKVFKSPQGRSWGAAYIVSENSLPKPGDLVRLREQWRGDLRF